MLSAEFEIFEDLGIPRRCGMFDIKNNKRDNKGNKVIKIIKGQSNKNYVYVKQSISRALDISKIIISWKG